MDKVLTLAMKDLRVLLRDRAGFFFTFFFPLIIAVFFGSVFGSGEEGRGGIGLLLVDADSTQNSQHYAASLESAPELRVARTTRNEARERVRRGRSVAYVVLKPGFGDAWKQMFQGNPPEIEIGLDPARQAEAGLLQGVLVKYASARFQEMFGSPASGGGPNVNPLKISVEDVAVERIGPNNSYAVTFPQGIIWGLIGASAAFGISLVIERTRGTLVRLRMSPVSRMQILGGKALGCFVTAVAVSSLLLLIAVVVFGVRPISYPNLALAVVCSGVAFAGIMMMLAVVGRTERSAGGIGWAVLLLMSMTGGGMIPLFAMPGWMQKVSNFSPVKWSVLSVEGAIWRGFSLNEMMLPCGILLAVGLVFFGLGVRVFRLTEEG